MDSNNGTNTSSIVSYIVSSTTNATPITNTASGTTRLLTNVTSLMTSASRHTSDENDNATAKALAVVFTLGALVVVAVLGYCYLKRSGKLARLSCHKYRRARRSSTSSSRRALEENDVMETATRSKPAGERDDTFTIEDFDDTHQEVGGKEEYYYDEVFGMPQFEDEATNTAIRELYSTRESGGENDEEMLDLDFETLGIKIDKMDTRNRSSK